MDRRTFVKRTAGFATAQACLGSALGGAERLAAMSEAKTAGRLEITADWDHVISSMPQEMLGLSYESSQLASPDFFSARNTELIAFFRKMSPTGVLRLGGNYSEFTVWTPNAVGEVSHVPFSGIGADTNQTNERPRHVITPLALTNLREFLDLTGWRAIYGLNLALADTDRVVSEAVFVSKALGPKLIAFQIGNEPDHYVMNGLRTEPYEFADYFREWSKVHSSVIAALPGARFAGPDIAERQPWIEDFANVAPQSVMALTGHYYAEGPPTDPSMTLDRLMRPNPHLDRRMEATQKVVERAHLPYVMAETNSCYNGGKAGVSDVFGSALWALNYTLQLASMGAQGVYFHGGGDGWYTPIAGGTGKPFQKRPIYSGIEACREVLGAKMVAVRVADKSRNVFAYGFEGRRLVVINAEAEDLAVKLNGGGQASSVIRLSAPSPQAKAGISVRKDSTAHGMMVPAYSAAIFEFGSVSNEV